MATRYTRRVILVVTAGDQSMARADAHAAVPGSGPGLFTIGLVAPGTPRGTALTATMALALAQRLGLTDEDIACLLDAKDTTPEESQLDARVNSEAIARAYPASVTAALADGSSPIAVKCTKAREIEAHAARVRGAVRVVEKLTVATSALERAVRGDADVLDQVTREIVPQIKARAAVVTETAATFSSVLAYHQARYPGRHKKPKTPTP